MSKRSREELLRFLDYVRAKGLMSPATVEARKASANKVLAILDEQEASDVTVLDLDSVVERFSNLHGKSYTPDSLRTYRSRTKSAIEDFSRYLDNPLAFKPGVQKRDKRTEANGGKSASPPKPTAQQPQAQSAQERIAVAPAASDTILPIPLRADLTVYIQGLPFDLTAAEARKLAAVVQAMALGE